MIWYYVDWHINTKVLDWCPASETSVLVYRSKRRHIPNDHTLHQPYCCKPQIMDPLTYICGRENILMGQQNPFKNVQMFHLIKASCPY